MPILYEPTSTRGDHGIWKMTYGQPSKTPFRFDWKGRTAGGELLNFKISTTCSVEFVIKERLSDKIYLISKKVQMGENNSVMLEITAEESLMLLGGKQYHLTATLYDENDTIIRILLRDLPIVVDASGVSDEY